MLPIRTILHPTDFSRYSEYAFQLACSLARDHGAQLLVLHVVPPPQMVVYDGMPVSQPAPTLYREGAEERLRQIKPVDPKVKIEHRLEEGPAAPEILRVAEETKADLIIMGTHGWTGLARLLMGSIAEKVVRKAPCPVLTLKGPFVEAAPLPLSESEGGEKSKPAAGAARS